MPETDVRRTYNRLARRYDQKWAEYVEATVEATIERLPLEPGMRVLDVGCGTGVLLEKLIEHQSDLELTGVDLSAEMLDVAGDRLPENVRLMEENAVHLPFDPESFDLVVSTSVFHFVESPLRSLREMHRILDDDGKVVISDWCTDFLSTRIIDIALHWMDPAHHKTYGSDEIVDYLRRAGFSDIDVDCYRIDWKWGMMTAIADR